MGLLSDFFIADGASVPNYDGGDTFEAADKCQYRRLSTLQAAQFLAVFRGQEFEIEMMDEFELLTPEDAVEWTHSVPQDMVTTLANLEERDFAAIAAKFVDATREELAYSLEDFVLLLRDLSALARRAIANHKRMYLWNCI
jgi:hypothetical protein